MVTLNSRRIAARLILLVMITIVTWLVFKTVSEPEKVSQKPPEDVVTQIDSTKPDPVIMAAGDIACSAAMLQNPPADQCRMRQTAELIEQAKPTAVLALGDLQYDNGSLADFNASYQPTWGAFKGLTRPAIGNHEYGNGGQGYFDYFGLAAGQRGQGYYSFDLGGWHLIALNSNCDRISCRAGGEQDLWLREDLASHKNKCTLAYFHHPRFSSGRQHGNNTAVTPLWQALYENGVELVLNGHEHNYERFAPQDPNGRADTEKGIRQFVVGTGGRNLYAFRSPQANSQARYNASYGALKMTLHSDSYEWDFITQAGSGFSDKGSQTCH